MPLTAFHTTSYPITSVRVYLHATKWTVLHNDKAFISVSEALYHEAKTALLHGKIYCFALPECVCKNVCIR